jgi:hypothetical protein
MPSVVWQIILNFIDLGVFCTLAWLFRARNRVLFFAPSEGNGEDTEEMARIAPLFTAAPFEQKAASRSRSDVNMSLAVITNPASPEELRTHPWKFIMLGMPTDQP